MAQDADTIVMVTQCLTQMIENIGESRHPWQTSTVLLINTGESRQPWQTPTVLLINIGESRHPWQTPTVLLIYIGESRQPWQTSTVLLINIGESRHPWQTSTVLLINIGESRQPWQTPTVLLINIGESRHPWQTPTVLLILLSPVLPLNRNALWVLSYRFLNDSCDVGIDVVIPKSACVSTFCGFTFYCSVHVSFVLFINTLFNVLQHDTTGDVHEKKVIMYIYETENGVKLQMIFKLFVTTTNYYYY